MLIKFWVRGKAEKKEVRRIGTKIKDCHGREIAQILLVGEEERKIVAQWQEEIIFLVIVEEKQE